MRQLAITVPAAERDAINAALGELGFGTGNFTVPLRNGEPVSSNPTHYGSHWYVTEAELLTLREVRGTVLANAAVNEAQGADPLGLFQTTNGDYVRIVHKRFDNGRWGWRAQFFPQAGEFEPGVRAIAIYSDPEHQDYLYTTGAFTQQSGRWVTEWNDGRPEKADVHWALLFAALVEHSSTLNADAAEDIGWLRIGVPGGAVPPGVPEWAPATSYRVGDRVTYQGTEYTCRQAHTSQVGWEPPNVLALWLPV